MLSGQFLELNNKIKSGYAQITVSCLIGGASHDVIFYGMECGDYLVPSYMYIADSVAQHSMTIPADSGLLVRSDDILAINGTVMKVTSGAQGYTLSVDTYPTGQVQGYTIRSGLSRIDAPFTFINAYAAIFGAKAKRTIAYKIATVANNEITLGSRSYDASILGDTIHDEHGRTTSTSFAADAFQWPTNVSYIWTSDIGELVSLLYTVTLDTGVTLEPHTVLSVYADGIGYMDAIHVSQVSNWGLAFAGTAPLSGYIVRASGISQYGFAKRA